LPKEHLNVDIVVDDAEEARNRGEVNCRGSVSWPTLNFEKGVVGSGVR
jgi:hypothetical protein